MIITIEKIQGSSKGSMEPSFLPVTDCNFCFTIDNTRCSTCPIVQEVCTVSKTMCEKGAQKVYSSKIVQG